VDAGAVKIARFSLAVLAAAVALAACGGDDETTGPGVTTVTTTVEVTTTEPAPTTTAPTTTEPAEPSGSPFSTAPATGPALSTRLALLTDVRLGGHEGYERIVFEFLPGARPGYRVRYVRPPIIEDASGRVVEVEGDAFLASRLEPASGFDLTGELGEVYTGPTRIDGASAGTDTIEELVRTGDFEAVLSWVAGLDERAPFRVLSLGGPPRIVIDVRTAD
jgi:hypothetical protein